MNTKEKKLAMVLASGLIVSNLGVVTASADTNVANNNSELAQNQQVNYPTVAKQIIKFDASSSENLVITGIDYLNEKLVKFTVADDQNIHELDVNKLIYDDAQKTLTIPADVLKALNLSNGMHACGVTFSDGTLYVGLITIYTTNSNTSTTPPVVPPSNDETDVDQPSNGETDVNPPSNDGTDVDQPSNVETDVIPPSNDGTDVDQPSNDKDSEIIIDINNLTQVEIPNFIPNNSKVDYVIINGKKLPVIYKNLRNSDDISSAPAVYIVGDKLVLSPEVLEYIGFDSSTYDIQAVLEDGSVVSKTISLNITNSTEKPVEEQKPAE